jgi:hypothetical protein
MLSKWQGDIVIGECYRTGTKSVLLSVILVSLHPCTGSTVRARSKRKTLFHTSFRCRIYWYHLFFSTTSSKKVDVLKLASCIIYTGRIIQDRSKR